VDRVAVHVHRSDGVAYLGSYIAIVHQLGFVSSGGYFLIFWQFQNAPDLLFSVIKGRRWPP